MNFKLTFLKNIYHKFMMIWLIKKIKFYSVISKNNYNLSLTKILKKLLKICSGSLIKLKKATLILLEKKPKIKILFHTLFFFQFLKLWVFFLKKLFKK